MITLGHLPGPTACFPSVHLFSFLFHMIFCPWPTLTLSYTTSLSLFSCLATISYTHSKPHPLRCLPSVTTISCVLHLIQFPDFSIQILSHFPSLLLIVPTLSPTGPHPRLLAKPAHNHNQRDRSGRTSLGQEPVLSGNCFTHRIQKDFQIPKFESKVLANSYLS